MKNKVVAIVFSLILLGGMVLCIVRPSDVFSESERRELASFPSLSGETVLSGAFMRDFETYAAERIPYRDGFRAIKAWFSTKIFRKLDNNGLFMAGGHISKIDSTENPAMMEHAAKRFEFLYKTYMEDKNVRLYLSIVPDKNFILAPRFAYPSMGYDGFIEKFREMASYMQYVDVTDLLELADYYKTDTHWRQERITDIAERLGEAMGAKVSATYTENILEKPFYGVYAGQLAMPVEPDEIHYLTNQTLANCKVTYYDTGAPKVGDMYNIKKAEGKDPYDLFLSGASPIITIENPAAETDRKLVLFRDSYASSLAPLLVEGYKNITLVDIRYIQSGLVGNFVDFQDADVLFLYSTTLLNNSLALK